MNCKYSRQPAITSESLCTSRLAVLLFTLLLSFAGCKEKQKATSAEANNEAQTVSRMTAEGSKGNASNAKPKSSEPEVSVPSIRPMAADSSTSEMSDQIPVSEDPATGSPAVSPESSNSGPTGKRSPQDALAAAKKYQESATNLARQGKLEPAYKAAVEGWQMVRIHPSDPNCKKVAAELLEDIRNYSDQLAKAAGGEAGMPNDSKPIRFE